MMTVVIGVHLPHRRHGAPSRCGSSLAVVLVIAAGACGNTELRSSTPPILTAIEPVTVTTCRSVPARLIGAELRPVPHVNVDNAEPSAPTDEWLVRVGDHAATEVLRRSTTALDLRLPELPAGTWDITTITPDHQSIVLPAALTVTSASDGSSPAASCDALLPVTPCALPCGFQFGTCKTSFFPGFAGSCGAGVRNHSLFSSASWPAIRQCLGAPALPVGARLQIDFDYLARADPPRCYDPPVLTAISLPSGQGITSYTFSGCIDTSGAAGLILQLGPGDDSFTLSLSSGDWGGAIRVRAITLR